MGNARFALALLRELETSGEQQVQAIESQAIANDIETLSETAHSLKGAAAILGAEKLSEIAADIEAISTLEELGQSASLIESLRGEMDRCLKQISEIRASAS